MSKLKTTTSSTRHLADPSTGDLFFETDTSRLVFWDGSVWHVYRRDSINHTTGGAEELHYATGLFNDTQNANHITQNPVMHFDSMRIGSIAIEHYGAGPTVIDSSNGPFGWVNIASPGVKDIYFSGYSSAAIIDDKGSGIQSVSFNAGTSFLANGTDPSQYTANAAIASFTRQRTDPVTLMWLTKRTGTHLHPVAWSGTGNFFGSFGGNDWQSYSPLGGPTIRSQTSLVGTGTVEDKQAAWDNFHAKFGADYILQIVQHDGGTGSASWYVNGDTYTISRGADQLSLQNILTPAGTQDTENYEMFVFDQAVDGVDINRVISYLNNKYGMTQPVWS